MQIIWNLIKLVGSELAPYKEQKSTTLSNHLLIQPVWILEKSITCDFMFGLESHNHRMGFVGMDLKDHLVPTPLPRAGTPPTLPKAPSSLALSTSRDIRSFSGQPVPGPHHPQSKEILPNTYHRITESQNHLGWKRPPRSSSPRHILFGQFVTVWNLNYRCDKKTNIYFERRWCLASFLFSH